MPSNGGAFVPHEMIANVMICVWVLLYLIPSSGDAIISDNNELKPKEGAKKFSRIISSFINDENGGKSDLDIGTTNGVESVEEAIVGKDDTGVIAKFLRTSRLQCSHRCKLNEKCKDVAYKDGNICILLDRKGVMPTGRMEVIHPGMQLQMLRVFVFILSTSCKGQYAIIRFKHMPPRGSI